MSVKLILKGIKTTRVLNLTSKKMYTTQHNFLENPNLTSYEIFTM